MSVVTISSTLMSLFQGHVACWNFILIGAGWLVLLLKGVPFYPVHLMYKKILISKQILVLSFLVFIQKDHVVIAVKDALSRYTPPVPEEYYKVLHICNTFRCSQLITILQCIVCIILQYTYYYTTYVQYIILIILQYSRCFLSLLSMLKLANVSQSTPKNDKSRPGLGLALHEGF